MNAKKVIFLSFILTSDRVRFNIPEQVQFPNTSINSEDELIDHIQQLKNYLDSLPESIASIVQQSYDEPVHRTIIPKATPPPTKSSQHLMDKPSSSFVQKPSLLKPFPPKQLPPKSFSPKQSKSFSQQSSIHTYIQKSNNEKTLQDAIREIEDMYNDISKLSPLCSRQNILFPMNESSSSQMQIHSFQLIDISQLRKKRLKEIQQNVKNERLSFMNEKIYPLLTNITNWKRKVLFEKDKIKRENRIRKRYNKCPSPLVNEIIKRVQDIIIKEIAKLFLKQLIFETRIKKYTIGLLMKMEDEIYGKIL